MRHITIVLASAHALLLSACNGVDHPLVQDAQQDVDVLVDAWPAPRLVAPGLVSTRQSEYSPTFDAGRGELYFMRRTPGLFDYTIWIARRDGERWSEAQIAPFSGEFRDAAPYLAPDGESLLFDSRRETEGWQPESIDLYRVQRVDGEWGAASLLRGASRNQPQPGPAGYDEFGPAVDGEGRLWFYSFRQPLRAGAHYTASRADAPAEGVERDLSLPDPSASTFVCYLYMAPDRSFAVMEGRAPGARDSDLFFALRQEDGSWSAALPVPGVNTGSSEGGPWVTPDGTTLFFTSDRPSGDDRAAGANLWSVELSGRLVLPQAR